jgi:hypothetical protein
MKNSSSDYIRDQLLEVILDDSPILNFCNSSRRCEASTVCSIVDSNNKLKILI